jgi:hypothetical protein
MYNMSNPPQFSEEKPPTWDELENAYYSMINACPKEFRLEAGSRFDAQRLDVLWSEAEAIARTAMRDAQAVGSGCVTAPTPGGGTPYPRI